MSENNLASHLRTHQSQLDVSSFWQAPPEKNVYVRLDDNVWNPRAKTELEPQDPLEGFDSKPVNIGEDLLRHFYRYHARYAILYYELIKQLNQQANGEKHQQQQELVKLAYFLALALYYVYSYQLCCFQEAKRVHRDIPALERALSPGCLLEGAEEEISQIFNFSDLKDSEDLLPHEHIGLWRSVKTKVKRTLAESAKHLAEVGPLDEEPSKLACFANAVHERISAKYLHSELIPAINHWRLLFVRINRIIYAASILFPEQMGGPYRHLSEGCKLAHLGLFAALFYVPRLLIQSVLFVRHVVPGFWMDEAEKALGWQLRFKTQFERRSFQWFNDAIWFVSNLLTCGMPAFHFVTPMLATILTVGLYVFDVINFSWKLYLVYRDCDAVKKELQALPADGNDHHRQLLIGQIKDLEAYQLDLKRDIHNKLIIATVLLVGMIPMLLMALCPVTLALQILFFAGCLLTTGTTLVQIFGRDCLSANKPEYTPLSKQGFFPEPVATNKEQKTEPDQLQCCCIIS